MSRRILDTEREEMTRRVVAGESYGKVARAFGVSRNSLAGMLFRAGVKTGRPRVYKGAQA